ncbi:50S ribosomal protein L25/general stress protein Ctc [Corynebacterium pacaense]|uniref:50S ribosomal protein L25/general stress protein Ctc n=1 Tax=Corynebacterium pacaense TaxID=1816684 RepID=UPI0009B93563|nr:50S ribosomal protein L25/general stress protein Ctc [Corynebacterium pacaense]
MASSYPTIEAAIRTEFGKGSARRARVAGQIPAVIYGADLDSNIHLTVDHQEFAAVVRNQGVNAVIEIDAEGEKHLTMIKHIDQNVLTFNIDHLDLLAIKRGEKVEVEVPVVIEGEPADGTIFVQDANALRVEADVLNIPEEFVISVEGLEFGTQITAGDVALGDATLAEDPELLIVNIVHPAQEEAEEEAEPAEDAEAPAESE